MRKTYLAAAFTALLYFSSSVMAQEPAYWQQFTDYNIQVSLDDVKHELNGNITIRYTNNSPDELNFIYFHLWPNAYKDNSTEFARQERENKSTDFQFASADERGYIDQLDFKVDGNSAKLEFDGQHIDYAKLLLDKPLKTGETVTITTPFHVKIPSSDFSRLGHSEQSYQITQWYPKPAVYDKNGWNQIPYLNQGEFYSEFGNFDVRITLPANYVVAASGNLQTKSELDFLDKNAEETKQMKTDKKDLSFPPSSPDMKTIEYKMENAHDFAWFADKRFHVLKGEVILPYSQKKVATYSYFTDLEAGLWMRSIEYINRAVLNYSDWIGEYQWDICQALEGALSAGAGMEYPTITIIGKSGNGQTLDNVITHEVGHNWFYGMLGFNERRYPWMDEGINSYYEQRYMEKYYPGKTLLGQLSGIPVPEKVLERTSLLQGASMLNAAFEKTNLSQPVSAHSMEYTSLNYGTVVYMKTAYCFNYLADFLGQNTFDRAMGVFFKEWKMKHVYPEDMQKVLEAETGEDLNWFFNGLLKDDRSLDYRIGDMQVGKSSIVVRVTNNTDIVAPFPISQMDGDSIVKTDWQRGFLGTQTIYLNRKKDQEVTAVKINASGVMPEYQRENNTARTKGLFKHIEPLQLKFLTSGFDNPNKTNIFYSPILGANANDGFMLGLAVYNSTFPMPAFEYVFAPMYAFGSKNITGQGSLGLNFYPENGFASRLRIGIRGMNYTYYDKATTDSALTETHEYLDFNKLENSVQLTLRKKSLRTSPDQQFIFRNILIQEEMEEGLSEPGIFGDGEYHMYNELSYSLNKKRILYPYSVVGKFLQGDDFSRITAEFNMLVNYPKSKKGADIRLYAGYKTSGTMDERHQFSVEGNDGYHDFLYDEIFLGRNVYDGIFDNQIMRSDGFLKTDVPASDAYSSDYLFAANIALAIPRLPAALYFDYVYNPQAAVDTEVNMYDAGIALRLPKNIFEIYFPLLMSDFIKEGFPEDTKYMEKVKFMLNLNALNPFETLRKL